MNVISNSSRGLSISHSIDLTPIVSVLLAASCATQLTAKTTVPVEAESRRNIEIYSESHEVETLLYEEYKRWKGTRHRLGGSGRKGIDCSGFVRLVYKNVFNIDLLRTTRELVKLGKPVKRNELRAGDLVFFRPPTYPRHVGIFLKRMEFVQASKSNGVILSRINPIYWDKYYWTGRRILPGK